MQRKIKDKSILKNVQKREMNSLPYASLNENKKIETSTSAENKEYNDKDYARGNE